MNRTKSRSIRVIAFTVLFVLLSSLLISHIVAAEAPILIAPNPSAADAAPADEAAPAPEAEVEEAVTEEAAAPEEEAEEESPTAVYATFWALIPPVIAIILALITKEVYSSLFVGILTGGVLYAIGLNGFSFETMFNAVMNDGFIASLADSYNVGILIFLVMLGILVVLMNRAGGSRAYGRWAKERIKTKRGALLATFGLGALIFVDDYFNCLTVGSVMRPVTDENKISRAKLAYIIDATAAPVCIIAPISSWAAAVSGMVEGVNGIELFIRTIPYNMYALLTIAMVVTISIIGLDFGPMKKHEENAVNGNLFTSGTNAIQADDEAVVSDKGRVMDLILPVVVLVIFCVVGMVYTGGFFSGASLIEAFENCDAAYGLALGSVAALILNVIYFICRRVLSFRECMEAIPAGFKAMVPAILILTFAWTLKNMTGLLGADVFVAELVDSVKAIRVLLPAILFLVAVALAFATGTSWGTFGILIPIVTPLFEVTGNQMPEMLVICISACLAGAVCGDHCSPISDTTIMASTGAQCNHVNHVSTQLPYAMLTAGVCLVTYLLAGIEVLQKAYILLPIGLILMVGTLFLIKVLQQKKQS